MKEIKIDCKFYMSDEEYTENMAELKEVTGVDNLEDYFKYVLTNSFIDEETTAEEFIDKTKLEFKIVVTDVKEAN